MPGSIAMTWIPHGRSSTRIESVSAAPGEPFDHGLFRLIREHKDPALRALHGPLQVDEPRASPARRLAG